MRNCLILFVTIFSISASAQSVIKGHVTDKENNGIGGVNILVGARAGTSTDDQGFFSILVREKQIFLQFSHINFIPFEDTVFISSDTIVYNIKLKEKENVLQEISIIEKREREQASVTTLTPKNFEEFPAPFADVSRVLISLPGVISNNELSSSYSVRGGNFDENLVYVEGIPIYRPQISSNGQQEGLGFVNTSMVREIKFSAGGWQSSYGDKLSSVLAVDYLQPQNFIASATLGFLGGSVTAGSKIGNTSFIAGVRHKNSRYLLGTMDVEGEYFPRFSDVQLFSTTQLTKNTSLMVLGGYAKNRYEVFPVTRETEFGTFNQSYRLTVGFDGKDLLEYDTYQGGLKLMHNWNGSVTTSLIASAISTSEREYTELEGGYRLCDVNKNIGTPGFNECLVIRGIGTLYNHRRNYLKGEQYLVEGQAEIEISNSSTLISGIGWNYENFNDRLSEFSFVDSAGFVSDVRGNHKINNLERSRAHGFIQLNYSKKRHRLNTGVRLIYRNLTGEITLSPTLQYSYTPAWRKEVNFNLATGIYRQVPIYREFRDLSGELNLNLKMQSAWHMIAGMDHNLILWGRPFKFISEAYYKYMWNVNTYEVDNVRIRYFGDNGAKAYAWGTDFRLSGEFIKDTESWFSLSYLSTKEDVSGDNKGYIRRPMDQRVTVSIFFQDHLPDNPSFRVNVHVQYGSGLPFGPPDELENRNIFRGDTYQRVDIGFSKVFNNWDKLNQFTVAAEVLNLTGSKNTISYTWIEDVYNQQFAVPNTLSARFFNLKLSFSI